MLLTQTQSRATRLARDAARDKIIEQTDSRPQMMAKALTRHPERTLRLLWDARVLEDVTDILLTKGWTNALWAAATCVSGFKPARETIKTLAFDRE